MDSEAWRAAVHGVPKSGARLIENTSLILTVLGLPIHRRTRARVAGGAEEGGGARARSESLGYWRLARLKSTRESPDGKVLRASVAFSLGPSTFCSSPSRV